MLNDEKVTKSLVNLEKCLKNATVFIFGAGPSLENSIEQVKLFLKNNKTPVKIIAGDGAAKALLNNDLILMAVFLHLLKVMKSINLSYSCTRMVIIFHL